MALYVKDAEVDRLVSRVAAIHRISKTEAVKRALVHELEREGEASQLVERGMSFARALRSRAHGISGKSADKRFIDGLYEN